MTIKKLPSTERPYEKAQMNGIENLSNSELLAIIIKTGTKEKTSVQLAQEILSIESKNKENIQFLQDISLEELTKIKGIGIVKAIQIKAVCEMAKRISKPIDKCKIKVSNPNDAANILMADLKLEKREIVKVIILNSQNVVIKTQTISYGATNSAIIDPKDIFSEAIKIGAPKIILVHNHPSGVSTPSKQDIDFTKKIEQASKIIGIQLLDHIVIGYNEFTTIKSYLLKKEGKEII